MGYIIGHIALIHGYSGSGKTLFQAWTVKNSHRILPVVSNITFTFPNCSKIDLGKLISMKYDFTYMPIDELPSFGMDSRRAMTTENIYIGYFIAQSRKRKVDVLGSAQIKDTVDYRFLDVSDSFNIMALGYDESPSKKCFVYDFIFPTGFVRRALKLKEAQTVFNKYDTYEIIEPRGIEEMVVKVQSKEELTDRIESVSDRIIKEFTWDRLTHAQVHYFLIKLKEPKNLEPYVYSALQYKKAKGNEGKS